MQLNINGSLLYFDVENPQLTLTKPGIKELPVMIVLHGGPGYDHTPYKQFFSSLANTVQLIYIDMHGHGRSDHGTPKSWNFTRWVSDIYEFCSSLHITKPIIFGHSFGGMVALQYAISYPDNLEKLILCNTLAKFDINKTTDAFFALGGEKSRQAYLNFLANANNDEAKKGYALYCAKYFSVQKIDEQDIFYGRLKLQMDILSYFYENVIKNFDCMDKLKNIKVPTLILTGENDPIATVEMANQMAFQLGNQCYKNIIVSGTSHNMIWEKTQEINNYIKDFITNFI